MSCSSVEQMLGQSLQSTWWTFDAWYVLEIEGNEMNESNVGTMTDRQSIFRFQSVTTKFLEMMRWTMTCLYVCLTESKTVFVRTFTLTIRIFNHARAAQNKLCSNLESNSRKTLGTKIESKVWSATAAKQNELLLVRHCRVLSTYSSRLAHPLAEKIMIERIRSFN